MKPKTLRQKAKEVAERIWSYWQGRSGMIALIERGYIAGATAERRAAKKRLGGRDGEE